MAVRIGAPTLSNPHYLGTLGQTSVQNIHTEFPSGSNSSWKNFDRYTFHVAGEAQGIGMGDADSLTPCNKTHISCTGSLLGGCSHHSRCCH